MIFDIEMDYNLKILNVTFMMNCAKQLLNLVFAINIQIMIVYFNKII